MLTKLNVFEGKKVAVIVEAPTSRKAAVSGLIDFGWQIQQKVKNPNEFRQITLMHQRFDILGDVKEKLEEKYPQALTDFVQLKRTDQQTQRSVGIVSAFSARQVTPHFPCRFWQ